MSKSKLLGLAAVVAVAGLGCFLYVLLRPPGAPLPLSGLFAPAVTPPAAAPAASSRSATARVGTAAPPGSTAGTRAPASAAGALLQPPPNTPVQQLEAMLRSAADQGNPPAACRLGVELIRCRRIAAQQAAVDELKADASRATNNAPEAMRLAREIEQASTRLAEGQFLCNGVAPESARNAWRYLYAAAASGNVAAMSRFVRDPGLMPGAAEAKEGWEAYVRNAPDFLLSAIEGGDIRALHQGWFSMSTGRSISQLKVFERDPDKALAYGYALNGLVGGRRATLVTRSTEALTKEIGPERAARARQEGANLRAMYFAKAEPIEWGNENGETDVGDCWR